MTADIMKDDIIKAAKRVYDTLGTGHEETIYREAMNIELQEMGYIVKTEMPVSVRYKTTKGKEVIIGSVRVDLYIEKGKDSAILELKAVSPLMKEKDKSREKMKEHAQLQKYLHALGERKGFIINFPFPPAEEPEIIESRSTDHMSGDPPMTR